MRTPTIALLMGWSLFLLSGLPAPAEVYRCLQKDGVEIFTDKATQGQECRKYAPTSELIPAPVEEREPASILQPSEVDTRPPVQSSPGEPRAPGAIDFEKFRMISQGMSEGEVIGLAGPPAHQYNVTCDLSVTTPLVIPSVPPHAVTDPRVIPPAPCPRRWVYTYGDDNKWTVEVTFVGDRVTDVNNFRRPF